MTVSVASLSVATMLPIHPWRRFRELAHIELRHHDGGDLGVTLWEESAISLRRNLTQAQRRTTILHECLHVERGAPLVALKAREELRVERETARLLMPCIRAVGEALAWARDLDEAADELWVDPKALRCRLASLHPAERAYLKQRLEDAEVD